MSDSTRREPASMNRALEREPAQADGSTLPEPASFGAALQRLRLQAGLTQEALAERAGLSARGIQGLERGESQPQRETVRRLAAALHLGGDDEAHFAAAIRSRAPGVAPAREPAGARRHNLLAPVSHFVGREREMAAVRDLLERTRLLTVTGAGGMGKTRLALEVAAAVQAGYPDGVWLVDLAPLSQPALVTQAVAQVLNVPEEPGRPLPETLAAALAPRRLLLVLDNCEHLIAACAALAGGVLAAAPRLQILATSREALGIAGEQVWALPPLSLPPPEAPASPEVVRTAEAVQLLVERAQALRPTFALTAQNAAAVAQVCRRLDGIPLALELAAARLAALSVETLAARLDDRFRLLSGGRRTALPRQQTLQATLDWSYALLDDAERTLLRRLAVFAGGWTLEAAEAVCADEALASGVGSRADAPAARAADATALLPTQTVLDLLGGLVQKSLVVFDADEQLPGREGRYRLLETVRQYAAEHLVASGEAAALRDRHLRWYLDLAEQTTAYYGMPRPHQGYYGAPPPLHLVVEQDNLRATLGWAQETGQVVQGLRLAGALELFWWWHDRFSEGLHWLEAFLARAAEAQHGAWERGLEGSTAGASLRAGALCQAGFLAFMQTDTPLARDLAEQGLALFRAGEDRAGLAGALTTRACVARDEGDLGPSAAWLEESVGLWRALGDQRGLGSALSELVITTLQQGHLARAAALVEEYAAIEARERFGDPAHPHFLRGMVA